jgi:phenylalanyl-tRNA synthetase beta chain
MKLSAHWIRDFVDLSADDRRLAQDLTDVGIGVEGISGSGADTVFETEIGTNRPDAMNHYGVAREAAAIYDLPLKPIIPRLPAAAQASPFPIQIDEPRLCPRFSARVVRNVQIKPSPSAIIHRLALLDQRPINNAVDATNYVLWEIGKPTHVFDLDLIAGGKLIIRCAKADEKLKTLDGVERTLTAEDLVVADAVKPVGLAGVMGGFDTMITEKTRNILIESAWFDPASVRATARRHGLHTDASHRFERGADFESTPLSCDRVAELIVNSAGGQLEGSLVDVVAQSMDQAPLTLRVSEVDRILGNGISAVEIARILRRLGCELVPAGEKDVELIVRVPSWRLDIEREIDLIEEIARLYGYNKFSNTLPSYSGEVIDAPDAAKAATLRTRALALGYNEAVSLTFISNADAERFSSSRVLELDNPQSAEASVMRSTLVPGMLDMLAWNLNRDAENVRLFELGETFEMRGGERAEPKRACFGATQSALSRALAKAEVLDASKDAVASAAETFRSLKGDLESLLGVFECGEIRYDRETSEYFHPGRSARALINGLPLAQFGQLAARDAAARKLREDIYLAEIDLERLYALPLRKMLFTPLAKYPAVERDFSFVFSDSVTFGEMASSVLTLNIPDLRAFRPVEIFRGGSGPARKHSILLRVTLQSDEGTLRDEQITDASGRIVTALAKLGGVQRT